MDDFIRTLDDYAEVVNRMHGYGYIGNIEERVGGAMHFSSDHIVDMIKAGNVEPIIVIIKRDSDNYPYRMEVNVGTYTLYCLLCQEEYEELLRDTVLKEGEVQDEK